MTCPMEGNEIAAVNDTNEFIYKYLSKKAAEVDR